MLRSTRRATFSRRKASTGHKVSPVSALKGADLEELIAFLITGHVGVHLGQLSSWRRMIGLPPLF
jgi:hypothetical protein